MGKLRTGSGCEPVRGAPVPCTPVSKARRRRNAEPTPLEGHTFQGDRNADVSVGKHNDLVLFNPAPLT